MKIRTFDIRFAPTQRTCDERILNDFLSRIRVIRVKSAVVRSRECWTVSVLFEERPQPAGIPAAAEEMLTGRQRERYAALFAWRSRRAAETGRGPAGIASDRDLYNVARSEVHSPADLLAVRGFGPVKTGRYGREIIAVLESVG